PRGRQIMFCPQCAATNPDQAKFCRACGGELSLLPLVLSGRVPDQTHQLVTRSISNIQLSTAMLLLAIIVGLFVAAPFSWALCGVMAVIAVGSALRGVAGLKQLRGGMSPRESAAPPGALPAATAGQLGCATDEVVEPPSVTESTTELLEVRRQTGDEL